MLLDERVSVYLHKEVVCIPTYQRNHFLHCALKRIRIQDSKIPVVVFSDRGDDNHELHQVCDKFWAGIEIIPKHNYYGNSYAVMEMLRWAYGQQIGLVHVSEDDFMQAPDCLNWHREMHELFTNIFASCGWVFNRQAPIEDDLAFAPWFYAPNYSIKRDRLAHVVQHANPLYYNGMREYVLAAFPDSLLHAKGAQENTGFYEQDAVFQYCIEETKSQVAWNGIAKGAHCGASGYNRPAGPKFEGTLAERVAQVEELIADPWWRAELFTREVVEREIGHVLERRMFKYRATLPDGWATNFTSELTMKRLPSRINSVSLPQGAVLALVE
jgi:hypothetical protein